MLTQRTGRVSALEQWSPEIFRLRVVEPAISQAIRPGQFVMVRVPGRTDPLLGRPLALYDTVDGPDGTPEAFEVVFLVMGAGTRALAKLRVGDSVDVWGPLGNTFPTAADAPLEHLLIIAGGIGQTPFVAVTRELLGKRSYGGAMVAKRAPSSIRMVWGARTAAQLAGADDFRAAGADLRLATEDGSLGRKGRSTDLAEEWIAETRPTAIFSCGPEPMLEAVAHLAKRHQIPAWVSLETKMACGYGVCFSCVCPVVDEQASVGWDYRRVCLEGPVFPAEKIAWASV